MPLAPEQPAAIDRISPDTLKSPPWHAFQAEGARPTGPRHSWAVELAAPLAVVALLLAARAFFMALVVAGVAAVIQLVRVLSSTGRRWVEKGTGALAHWAGQAVAVLALAPAFFLVVTWVRLMQRFKGVDPLQLRSGDAPTFWLSSDVETRRARHIKNMFCTERLVHGRFAFFPLVASAVVFLVVAEAGLRLYGLGTPLLYVQDTEVGYYPKPQQRARHPGRIITINNYGMRSPDVLPRKAPGHFRILLLGDSTLAGTWVGNEELYSSLLQSNLNAAAGAEVFEVLNMGVNAWGPFHELGYVKKFGAFDADLAVICGPVWNCQRSLYGLDRFSFYPAVHPPRLALERVLYDVCWRYRAGRLGPPPDSQEERQRRLGIEAYAELARLLQQHGAEVLMEMLPNNGATLGISDDAPARQMAAQISERLGQLGVPVECAGPIFKDAQPAKKVYHDGIHFDRLGHRLYAAYLAERLSQISPRLKRALQGPR